jgi:hypothetical protein
VFSPGTPASSTTKTGRHDIAEILLKVALNTINQIKSNHISEKSSILIFCNFFNAPFNNISVIFIGGENWSTRRKPLTCRKSLTNFIT